MATADSVKTQIQSLITQANETTGKSDADLTTAVLSLVSGFGQSSGGSLQMASGSFEITGDTNEYLLDINDLDFVPDLIFVNLDETDITYDSTPTKAWLILNLPMITERWNYPPTTGLGEYKTNIAFLCRGAQGTNTSALATSSINAVRYKDESYHVAITRSSSTYPIIAGKYNWIAYKLWEV